MTSPASSWLVAPVKSVVVVAAASAVSLTAASCAPISPTLAFAHHRIALTASVTTNVTSDALGDTVARFHRPLGISSSFRCRSEFD